MVGRMRAGLATIVRILSRWHWARSQPVLRTGARWLVLFSPARTPKAAGESDLEFFTRIARSNRDQALPSILGLEPPEHYLCLEVRAGLEMSSAKPSVLDYALAQIGPSDAARLVFGVLLARNARIHLLAFILDLLTAGMRSHQTRVVMFTSNSMFAELLRLAACRSETGMCVEVLHGIASVAMKEYYDFLNREALGRLTYVNLIAGLVHFPSIERHLLRDATGEVAVNCHIWSRVGPDKTLHLPGPLVDQAPLAIVGGTSSAPNYFETRYFESECALMRIARQVMPDRAIVYCPHPANGRTDELDRRLEELGVAASNLPTFSMVFCAGAVVGAYSTSLFEAALLGKRVFLLPFDRSMLMPELLDGIACGSSAQSLEQDFRAFAATLGSSDDGGGASRLASASQQALGLRLEIE